jgi:hypothetical protein
MADVDVEPEVATGAPKKRTFRKYSYRCVDLDALHGRPCPALPRASPLLALPMRARSREVARRTRFLHLLAEAHAAAAAAPSRTRVAAAAQGGNPNSEYHVEGREGSGWLDPASQTLSILISFILHMSPSTNFYLHQHRPCSSVGWSYLASFANRKLPLRPRAIPARVYVSLFAFSASFFLSGLNSRKSLSLPGSSVLTLFQETKPRRVRFDLITLWIKIRKTLVDPAIK